MRLGSARESEIDLIDGRDGTILRLKCRPGRPETRPCGAHGGALRIDVAAPPEKGKANREVIAWLSSVLGVPKAAIEITRGEATPEKSVLIRGLRAMAVRELLSAGR